jgi:hypothetical protein
MLRRITLALLSTHASSPSGIDRAEGAVIVSFIDSIVVHEEHQGHFGKTEVGFNAVFFSLDQVEVVLIGPKEVDSRSPQQQRQDQTERRCEK